jgi:uncharacterized protein
MTQTYGVLAHRVEDSPGMLDPMIIKVSELDEQGLRIEEPEALGVAFTDPAWRLDRVTLEVEADGIEVFVRGRLSATVPLTCSRCAEAVSGSLDAEVDVRMVPRPPAVDSMELGADDLDVDFYDNDQLDLARVVENETTLALPMKPLCRPDCRGLCSVCGSNRNVVPCACAAPVPDPRLAALGDLAARHTN